MPSVFYERFERHAHGEGLKGHATHYCAGCGRILSAICLETLLVTIGWYWMAIRSSSPC